MIPRPIKGVQKGAKGQNMKYKSEKKCPIAVPRHLAQKGIGIPFILKHLFGIP